MILLLCSMLRIRAGHGRPNVTHLIIIENGVGFVNTYFDDFMKK